MVQTSSTSASNGRRAEILRKASEVFGRKGFHETGMREIAERLGMVPGALYYYFESKDDLLFACQALALDGLIRAAREAAAAAIAPAEKVRRLVLAHLTNVLTEMGGGLAHVEFRALPEERLSEVVKKRDEYERLVRRMIAEGVAAGEFRAVDAKLAALQLLGSLNWAVVWWRPDGGRTVAEVAEGFAEMFLGGIRA